MNNKYKILVIAPAWVGDLVMSQTLFKLLKKQYGDNLELDVCATSWSGGILSRMSEVNNVIANPFAHKELSLLKRIKLGKSLINKHYDQVIILPNSFKSAIIPFFAKIKKRTGFIGECRYGLLNDIVRLDRQKLPLMVDRFCALANSSEKLLHIGYPQLIINQDNQQKLITKFNLDHTQPIIAFCPAAEYGPAKRWFPEHFAKLADMLIKDNYQVIILGSDKDVAIAEAISNSVISMQGHACPGTYKNKIINACGKTNLTDAIDLLGLSHTVVTNDSGLMHIACAVNSNVVALYGASSPKFTPPLSDKAAIIQVKLFCSPCMQRTCRFGHYNCLKFITPKMVYGKIKH
jgi:heptosyltransferase II